VGNSVERRAGAKPLANSVGGRGLPVACKRPGNVRRQRRSRETGSEDTAAVLSSGRGKVEEGKVVEVNNESQQANVGSEVRSTTHVITELEKHFVA
jgi:hypothetical protein